MNKTDKAVDAILKILAEHDLEQLGQLSEKNKIGFFSKLIRALHYEIEPELLSDAGILESIFALGYIKGLCESEADQEAKQIWLRVMKSARGG